MLTFEIPFHDMCANHTGILYKLDRTITQEEVVTEEGEK